MAVDPECKRTILALNCGSSSLKFGLYRADARSAEVICEGEAEEIGGPNGSFWFSLSGQPKTEEKRGGAFGDHATALAHCLDVLKDCNAPRPEAVGHRFVHGGPRLIEHTLLDAAVMKELESAAEYAPLHLPTALAVLHSAERMIPGVPQVVCFDTAFHRNMPEVSRTYPLPEKVRSMGVRRYGFHGLSLESIVAQLPEVPNRMVVAHLGNGASVSALRNGVSIDTSMGLTPTGGVMMGTRSGDIDPGIVIFLIRHGFSTVDELETLFDHQAGLLGVSGVTSDVRELLAQRREKRSVDLALSMFCYQVRKTIAGMAAALGGLDLLVFTGGIGEHNAELRAEICRDLLFLDVDATGPRVKALSSKEDEQIARNTARLI